MDNGFLAHANKSSLTVFWWPGAMGFDFGEVGRLKKEWTCDDL